MGTPSALPTTLPADPRYPYVVKGTGSDGSEIRKFANERVASAIDDAIASANLKPGQSTAIVVTYKDSDTGGSAGTIRGAVMKRVETTGPSWIPFLKSKKIEWSFAGVLSHDLSTGSTRKEAGVIIRL